MGSSSSKSSRAGAGITRHYPRKHQSRHDCSPTPTDKSANEGTVVIPESAVADFSQRLRNMGAAGAQLTWASSSPAQVQHKNSNLTRNFLNISQNTTLAVLQARKTLQHLANDDALRLGSTDRGAKRFADMRVAVDAVRMRDNGSTDEAIEKMLHLQPGSMSRVGTASIISYVAQKSN
ncbi:hypothetical protein E4U21_004111 [Claviceps maximensis]|nr:hypothetical protein E4U21_004111 [Claviceps maximensis]